MAGMEGLEPPNAWTKTMCLTTWRHPNMDKNMLVFGFVRCFGPFTDYLYLIAIRQQPCASMSFDMAVSDDTVPLGDIPITVQIVH